jgi:nucleoid-associated protein YgaU
MTTARTRLRGLLASLALLAIVAGLPLALLAIGASPVPASMPTLETIKSALSSQDDGTLALGFIKVAAWAAWTFLTGSIILELSFRVRGIRVPSLPGIKVPQSAARALVGTAMLLFIAAPLAARVTPVAAVAPIPAAMAPAVVSAPIPAVGHNQTSSTPTTGHFSSPPEVARSTPTAQAPRPTFTHTVVPGETLWSIASNHLGAGERYPQIAALNTNLLGRRPGFLKPGWVLNLPAGPQDGETGERTVTVRRGDTLSEIAQEQLGDPARYPEIFAASQAITQPGGAHLRDPDVIDVGWTLTIPDTTTKPSDPETAKVDPPQRQSRPAAHPQGQPTPNPGPRIAVPTRPARVPATAPPSTGTTAPAVAGQADPPTNHLQSPGVGAPPEGTPIASWMLEGLTGAGTVLAGSMLLLLRRRRRAQFRARRPGRTIAVPEPVLAPVEKTLTASGSRSAPTVELMDALLRRLAAHQCAATQNMPELAAVELTQHCIVLHLSQAQELPTPWQGSENHMRLTWPADVDIDEAGPEDRDQPAPYPLLVTIGASDDDHVWLLNCEDLPVITITGDPTYGQDFARYLAAELACNPWSSEVSVDCVGIAAEIAPMNPQRVRYHGAGTDVAADILLDTLATIQRVAAVGQDLTNARAAQLGDDTWPSRLLLIGAASPTTPALTQLLHLVAEHPGRTGTCVVLTGDYADGPGVVLEVSAGGRVSIPHAGLDLVAAGLTSDEAQGCAALLTQSEDLADVPIPADGSADTGWRSFTNAAGALRTEHTLPRGTPAEELDEPTESVLDGPDAEYLREAATTAEDLGALAPQVPTRVRAQIDDADPGLDADLEAWFADDSDLPRLTLLGPVGARTRGSAIAVARRKPYFTEILAYLGTHPNGVTPAKLADTFGIAPSRARTDIMTVRDWLGVNPRTGQLHLPHARDTQASKTQGFAVYQVEGLLIDADMFRRLRVRGQARGADGIADLRAALTLVTGQPFDQLRTSGWSWLHEGDRLDQHMLCAVVDVAHMVTTSALMEGEPAQARAAAELAARACPDEEIPRLDLAAVAAAEGHHHEAECIVREEVCDRSDDGQAPMELSERTESIIASHEWLTPGEAAS